MWFRFEDDRPGATIQITRTSVAHDETAGLRDADSSNPDVIALFAGVTDLGADLSLVTPIAVVITSSSLVRTTRGASTSLGLLSVTPIPACKQPMVRQSKVLLAGLQLVGTMPARLLSP